MAHPVIVVPDASLILKWVLEREEEEDFPKALALQQAFLDELVHVRVPTLWRYEVGNILGLKKPDLCRDVMSVLLAYRFDEVELSDDYCLAVLQHMVEVEGVTFYDSAYHVLALRTKGVYVTADDDYVKRAKRKGHVILLSEWQPPKAPPKSRR